MLNFHTVHFTFLLFAEIYLLDLSEHEIYPAMVNLRGNTFRVPNFWLTNPYHYFSSIDCFHVWAYLDISGIVSLAYLRSAMIIVVSQPNHHGEKTAIILCHEITSWWFGTIWNHGILWLSIYWECHHPNWLIFFRRVETTNQINTLSANHSDHLDKWFCLVVNQTTHRPMDAFGFLGHFGQPEETIRYQMEPHNVSYFEMQITPITVSLRLLR